MSREFRQDSCPLEERISSQGLRQGLTAAAAAKSLQSCLILCDPIDGSPPGSSIPRILQARNWSGLPVPSPTHPRMLSRFRRVQLCATPWTAAHQALLSTGFRRQEHWSGCHFLLPRPTTNGEHFIKTEIKYSPIFILHLKY